jgi:hypothetical protein
MTISKPGVLPRSLRAIWIAALPPAIQVTSTIPSIRTLLNRSPLRRGLRLTPFVLPLAWLALSPPARAACNEGCDFAHGNTFLGVFALGANTTGSGNTAIGDTALNFNTTGGSNTAVGFDALQVNTTGIANTAVGFGALFKNTASGNTAFGGSALEFNTTGRFNTATGQGALNGNTTGSDNTANGIGALIHNTTASNNTATGFQALNGNTTGANNTANGFQALFHNTTAFFNTANGFEALFSNTTGVFNTATGVNALFNNTTGAYNMANGVNALFNNTTGGNNIALGINAGYNLTTGSNNIDINNLGGPNPAVIGVGTEANTIRIGFGQTSTFIAGISGTAVAGVGVVVNGKGQLGVAVSSERFKEAIKPMEKASEAILALEPVTFRYKQQLDSDGIPQFGLVAEQVEKVNPDLVARDAEGKAYTVRYEAVNVMLLNEFLKEHRKVEKQEATIAQQHRDFQAAITKLEATITQQQKEMEVLAARFKEQAAQIRKVSDLLEVNKPAPQLVANNQ